MSTLFSTLGPLDPKTDKLYVERAKVDPDVKNAVRAGEIVALIGPRQTGKTSLLYRLWGEYQKIQTYEPMILDISPIEEQSLTKWYEHLLENILKQAKPREIRGLANVAQDHLGFRDLMTKLSKHSPPSARIVLMLDELGTLPKEIRHSFLATIREIYNARFLEPYLEKLSFILAGTYLPEDLIERNAVSPFNVAKRVYTTDAEYEGVKKIASLLGELGTVVTDEAIERIFWWTHGHLYLTQRICTLIERHENIPTRITAFVIDQAVEELLHSGDINLAHLMGELDNKPEMVDFVQDIRAGKRIPFQLSSRNVARMGMLGIIRQGEDSQCIIRNRIYEKILESRASEVLTIIEVIPPSKKKSDGSKALYDDFRILLDGKRKIRVTTEQEGEVTDDFILTDSDGRRIRSDLRAIEKEEQDEQRLKDFGGLLFDLLFRPSILQRFEASLARTKRPDCSGLRIRLTIDDPDLAAWPWELLYYSPTNYFLANSSETALSRYLQTTANQRPIAISRPIRTLIVISSPMDLPKLDVQGETQLISEALNSTMTAGKISLDILRNPTLQELIWKLDRELYNVVHFIGHGAFMNKIGNIALSDDTGNSRLVKDEDFARIFLGDRKIGLIVLNLCEGTQASPAQIFSGLAPTLIQKSVPAVIGMQYKIEDDVAKLFSQNFYHYLADGLPVDMAIQKTRNAISIQRPGRRDFAIPVLYMRSKDGVIFGNLES